jgi:hypothetical protein
VLTITAPADSTCVLDYYERLALGSHLFPGSSLHSNLLNEDFGTAGIGAKDRSIPVKEISPQELSKTMTASQDQDVHWTIAKDVTPANVDLNDCVEGADTAAVTIKITWTKLPPQPEGEIQVITTITATNPASRPITINLTDVIYGAGDEELDTEVFAPAVLPANSSTTFTHTTSVPGDSTDLHDVATATYVDQATGIAIPGTVTAEASATVEPGDDISNDTATITDVESISGDGLSYSVDTATTTPSFLFATGGFAGEAGSVGYDMGDFTTDDVFAKSAVVSTSGSATFTKTIKFDGSVASSTGTLSDVAQVVGADDSVLAEATGSVGITATKCATLTVKKVTDPASDPQVFDFDLTGDGVPAELALDTNAASATPSQETFELVPADLGAHTVNEVVPDGWTRTNVVCEGDDDSSVDEDTGLATLDISPGEDVTCTYTNTKDASLTIVKQTDPASDPQDFHFDLAVPGGSSVPTDLDLDTDGSDDTLDSEETFTLPASDLGGYTITEAETPGWGLTNLVCDGDEDHTVNLDTRTATVDVNAGEDVTCTFTNTKGASLTVIKQTVPASDTQDFSFDLTGDAVPPELVLDTDTASGTPSQQTFPISADELGDYTVAEDELGGWDLTNLVCTGAGDDSSWSADDRTATLSIDADETVVCTFTNTKHASLKVVKVTIPSPDTQDFAFDLTGDAVPAELVLDTDPASVGTPSEQTFPISADELGDYTVTEGTLDGWDLTNLVCTGDADFARDGATANLDIDAGEDVICTFTNTKRGSITVKKVTEPANATEKFTFAGDLAGSIGNGEQIGPKQVVPGSYGTTETVPTGWALTGISCSDGDSSGNTATGKATFVVGAGEDVVCTFTNRVVPPKIVVAKTVRLAGTGEFGETVEAPVGSTVEYRMVVSLTAPGSLSNVTLSDPRCDAGTIAGPVKSGGDQDALLETGEQWTYTCTHVIVAGDRPGYTNTATASGVDRLGNTVTDTDTASVTVPAAEVLPQVPGTARLRGPSGCVRGPFKATVRGTRIARVTFFLDGKRFKRINATAGQTKFQVSINPRGRGFGVHRVTARVQFVAEANTSNRTLRLSFQRCKKQTVKPRFTG